MRVLGQLRPRFVGIVLEKLQNDGVSVTGPYRRRNGDFVYGVADRILTETELLEAQGTGEPNGGELRKLVATIEKKRT